MNSAIVAANILQQRLSSGQGVEPEYQAILDYAAANGITAPNSTIQAADNNFIRTLKAIEVSTGVSVWDKIDIFQSYYTGSGLSAWSTLNWKNPSLYRATLVNSPTFTDYKGFTGNGTNSYVNTGWKPGTNGVNLTQNDACYGVHYQEITTAALYDGCLSAGTARSHFNPSSNTSQALSFANTNGSGATFSSSELDGLPGLYFFGMSNSTTAFCRKNEGTLLTTAATSGIAVGRDFYLGCFNNNGSATGFNTRTFSMFFAGSALTAYHAQISAAWFARLEAIDPYSQTILFTQNGQSNSVGSNNTVIDNFSSAIYTQITPGFYISNNSGGAGIQKVTKFETYESDVNGRGALYGPDAALLKDLAVAGKTNIFNYKYAAGGTALNPLDAATFYWHPTDNTYPSRRLYPSMKAGLDNAIEVLYRTGRNRSRIELIWFWDQGEADMGGTQAAYYNALVAYNAQLLSDYPSYYRGKFITRRQYFGGSSTTVRLAQIQFCDADPTNRLYYNSDDLPKHDLDDVHLTILGQEGSGQRAAAAMLAASWIP